MKQVVAITGGIGTGKSTVAKAFESYGVPVYDSDKAAKRLMTQQEHLKNSIVTLLGSEAYLENGELHTKYISAQIFKDQIKREALNALVHPAVREDFKQWVLLYENNREVPYLLYESALVFQNHMEDQFYKVILVTAPEQDRWVRIQKRDGRSKEEILNIIKAQIGHEALHKTKAIVLNNEKLSNTLLKSKEIHHFISSNLNKI